MVTALLVGADMGLGKTIQTIAFLYAIAPKREKKDEEKWLNGNHLLSPKKSANAADDQDEQQPNLPILIIVPGSVLHNWKKELSTSLAAPISCLNH